ncbi:arginine--tRNA ligase, partial [Candidatus Pacearchaeota archaeon]|nr:arginine--tRNA ligase [Candidatus Pacearchaeota archaeon]
KDEGLGEKVVLRADGTSLYITQDLYLAKKKFEDYKNLNESIYVTANEQDYQFKVLFKILGKLKFPFAHKLKHVSYGLVNLPEGRMKSREGTVVDADDLIQQIQELAKENLAEKEELSKKEIERRSLLISLAAIKYFLLKVDKSKNMIFNPKESINMEGDTGPYLLYSYARANSILRKKKMKNNFKIEDLSEKEIQLVKKLSEFPEIVLNAYKNLNPSLIANYSYDLSQKFNEFYHSDKVIGSENENFRLALVESFKITLKNSLNLLGIETIERM